MQILTKLWNFFFGPDVTDGPEPLMMAESRSPEWPTVRAAHLKREPTCQACGINKNLSVHHIIPFHIDKSKELDQDNLITLCNEHHCHFVFGHLDSWYSYNINVREDAKNWLEKVKHRP
jgi:hypothetical protein